MAKLVCFAKRNANLLIELVELPKYIPKVEFKIYILAEPTLNQDIEWKRSLKKPKAELNFVFWVVYFASFPLFVHHPVPSQFYFLHKSGFSNLMSLLHE